MTPAILMSYRKDQKVQAIKFARSYSKTFKDTRVVLEALEDAAGITVWKNLNRPHDNSEIILFSGGKRKRAIA